MRTFDQAGCPARSAKERKNRSGFFLPVIRTARGGAGLAAFFLATCLAPFAWSGTGNGSAPSVGLLLAADPGEYRRLSEEETKARIWAKRHFDDFMKAYRRIWSVYGFLHPDFSGTPGNTQYAKAMEHFRRYRAHKEAVLDIVDKIRGPSPRDAEAKAQGFADWTIQVDMAIYDLDQDLRITNQDLAEMEREDARIRSLARQAEEKMNQACAAGDRSKGYLLARESGKFASYAVNSYKNLRNRWPEIRERPKKHEPFNAEFLKREALRRQFAEQWPVMARAARALLKEVSPGGTMVRIYFEKKKARFDELVGVLDKHLALLRRVTSRYSDRAWAGARLGEASGHRARVAAIAKRTPPIESRAFRDLNGIVDKDFFYDRRIVGMNSKSFDLYQNAGQKLENLSSLVSRVQEVGLSSKGTTVAAREAAKRARECARRIPQAGKTGAGPRCPSGWWQRGGKCCAPEVPYWDQLAIRRGYETGRCR